MLHVHPRQEVKVWAGVFEWVYHVVRHIRTSALLVVNPSAPQRCSVNVLLRRANQGIMDSLEPPLPSWRYSAVDQTTMVEREIPTV